MSLIRPGAANQNSNVPPTSTPESNFSGGHRQQPSQGYDNFQLHGSGTFGAAIPRGGEGDYYAKIKQGLIDSFKIADANNRIAVIDLNRADETALKFSAIVVAVAVKDRPQLGVAYHVLLLEATGDPLEPVVETYNGKQVVELRVTGDAFDSVLARRASEKVRRAFPEGPYAMIDGTVISRSFNAENRSAIANLAFSATLAANTFLLSAAEDFNDVNLAAAKSDNTLNINVGFRRQQLEDIVTNPIRSDFLVTFVSKKNAQQKRTSIVNTGDRETRLSGVSGFIETLWDPITPQNAYNSFPPGAPLPTWKYAGRAVMTDISSERAFTVGAILLAISTAVTLDDNGLWLQNFRPIAQMDDKAVDMTDVGALNIEANLFDTDPSGWGAPMKTKKADFTLEKLRLYLQSLIRPKLMFALDCPEYGPQSWYTSVFSAAQRGKAEAYNAIYKAANQLTNGAFQKYFAHGEEMFTDYNNRVHLGRWTDPSGRVRDLRDFDHIAVCNLFGKASPNLIRDWSDTWLRTEYPLLERLDGRRKMISALSNETAVFTGFADRVTFNGRLLDALSKGIVETQMPVNVTTPMNIGDFNDQRGTASFAQQAMMTQGRTFFSPYGGQQGIGNFGQYNGFRW